jgi:hypothetical protein
MVLTSAPPAILTSPGSTAKFLARSLRLTVRFSLGALPYTLVLPWESSAAVAPVAPLPEGVTSRARWRIWRAKRSDSTGDERSSFTPLIFGFRLWRGGFGSPR